jgi:hypothetical protein
MNRQRLILFILVILLACAVLWSYSAMPRPKTVSSLTYKTGQSAKSVIPAAVKPEAAATEKQVRSTDDGTKLKNSLLDKESAGFKGYRRNIFKPVFVDEVKVAKLKVEVIKPPPPKVIVAPPAPQVNVQPEAAPLARFTFMGFLKKGSARTIFLAKDKDILLVKKGDKIAGRYEATDISDQALTLTVTDTGAEIVIPLIENRPLTKAK